MTEITPLFKSILYAFTFIFFSITSNAQVIPKDHQQLCFTEIMFEHPPVKGASQYRIKIVQQISGKFHLDPLVVECLDSTPATRISHNIQFGKKYMWRYEALDPKRKSIFVSGIFHFETLNGHTMNPAYSRMHVSKECETGCDSGVVFLDGFAFAVNRNGIPKWFLPAATEGQEPNYRDIHLTPSGTVLYLGNSGAVETDLSGNILWKAPLNKSVIPDQKKEGYHHAFSKDAQSNYMICGKKNMIEPEASLNGDVLFEYDSNGNEIWRFDVLEAIKEKTSMHAPEDTSGAVTSGHMNGFAYDASKDELFISLRDFSSIFRINKTSKQILSFWGNKHISYELKNNEADIHLFALQHAPVLLKNGNLLVYNNNSSKLSSSIVELEAIPGSDNCLKVWEYVFDEQKSNRAFETHSDKMGSLQELRNGNILIGMGTTGRVLEISKDKRLIWELYPEKRADSLYSWSEAPIYRVSYASSLYPSYFTIEHRNVSKQVKMNSDIILKINNEGSEDDSYNIKLFYAGNNEPDLEKSLEIKRESSVLLTLKVTPAYPPLSPQKITVQVTPASNTRTSRMLYFEWIP